VSGVVRGQPALLVLIKSSEPSGNLTSHAQPEPKVPTATKETKPAVKVEKATRQFKEIKAIEFDTTPAGEDMVVVTLNKAVQPQFFGLDGGRPRLVCDFDGVSLGRGIRQRTKVNGNVIKQIRIGFYRGAKSKVRVVLDLETDKDYEARQVLSQEKGRYIIIVKSLDRNE